MSYSWSHRTTQTSVLHLSLGVKHSNRKETAVLVPRSFPTLWILSFHASYPCFSHLLLPVMCAVHAQLCQTKHFILSKIILKPSLVSSPLNQIFLGKGDTINYDLGMEKSHEGRQKLCFPGE